MRYLRLWLSFLKMSWMADLEYRINFVMRFVGEISFYVSQLSVFEVLYLHTPAIAGWDVNGMRVFMGTLFTTDVCYMILFSENMDGFAGQVTRGDLDIYLSKPISSQFMVSCRKISVAYFFNLAVILTYLSWGISRLPGPISLAQALLFPSMILSGLTILYSLRFMFAALSVLLHNAGNVQFIWHQLWRLGTRPDPIYPTALRLIVFTLFPVAFFASVPSRILVEGVDLRLVLASPLLAIVTLWLSHRWWNFTLRHYSSASS